MEGKKISLKAWLRRKLQQLLEGARAPDVKNSNLEDLASESSDQYVDEEEFEAHRAELTYYELSMIRQQLDMDKKRKQDYIQ